MIKRRLAVGTILVGISAFLLTFQNCGGGFQSGGNPSPNGTVTQGSQVPLKTEAHGCFELGTSGSKEYHLRLNPHNPSQTMVYFGNYWLPSADPGSFRVLDYRHARSNQFLYYQGDVVTELLPGEEIEILGYGYLRLKKAQVIVEEDNVLHLDAATFKVHTHGVYEDKDEKVGFAERSIPTSAVALGSGYFRVGDVIYYRGGEIPNVDVATFEVLTHFDVPMAQDKNFVYQYDDPITGARPGDLEPMPADIEDDLGSLWNDGVNVFLYSDMLGPVGSVSHLGFGWFKVDNTIYYWETPRPEIDAASFKVQGGDMAHDFDTFFAGGREYVFPAGFTFDATKIRFISGSVAIIGDYFFSAQGNRIWPFTGDVSKFKCLSDDYFFDGIRVVHASNGTDASLRFPGAIQEDLVSYGGSDDIFMDGKNVFLEDEVGPAILDPGSIRWINWTTFALDGNLYVTDGSEITVLNRSSNDILWKGDWQIGFADLYVEGPREMVTLSGAGNYRMLTSNYVATNSGVIFDGAFYAGVLGDSFRSLSNELSKDATRIYWNMIPVADLAGRSARLLNKNGLWALGSELYHENQVIAGVDPNSIETLSTSGHGATFLAAGSKVFFFGAWDSHLFNEGFFEISNDRPNFAQLGVAYWKDSTRVGIGGQTIPNGDPNVARAVGGVILDAGASVYYTKNLAVGAISGGDIRQYTYMIGTVTLTAANYWTDGSQVFMSSSRLTQASVETFQFVYPNSFYYWRDHDSIGYFGTVFDTTNPAAVQFYQLDGTVSGSMLADTGTSVYYGGSRISTARPGTISLYKINGTGHSCFWTDTVGVYCNSSRVTGADPATFVATERYKGRTATACYSYSAAVACTP